VTQSFLDVAEVLLEPCEVRACSFQYRISGFRTYMYAISSDSVCDPTSGQ